MLNEMTYLRRMVITAMLIAVGVVLPLAFHSIPRAGSILLPMHIPVLLAGLICGPFFGLVSGLITPLLSSITTGMPPAGFIVYSMMIELAVYGLVAGLAMRLIHTGRSSFDLYISLIAALIVGRVVAGMAQALVFFSGEGGYTIALWVASYFVTSLPGLVIQIIFVPSMVMALERERVIPLRYPFLTKKQTSVTTSSTTVSG